VFSLLLQFYVPYWQYVRYLKWLTLALFSYVATAFTIHVPWITVIRSAVAPQISWKMEYWMGLVAVLGTTISPYLFFWQSSEEVEEVRASKKQWPLKKKPLEARKQFERISLDTRVGMAFSNVIAFFVILTTALTIHNSGSAAGIKTAADAAKALEPLAGRFALLLFALGIVGTGLLAMPVLAGSSAYAVSEAFRWRASLRSKPRQASRFYFVIGGATILALGLDFCGLDPIRCLYLSAVANGFVAVPLMIILMIMSDNGKVVGQFRLTPYLRAMGWIATITMFFASCGFAITAFR
jgi:Mn2+/Fe2+ NRAMP family transporter